ncbi:MAG TPA: pyridoxal-dependent decarboxylase, exosortase A system-associated [Herbaspirillum sp.]|nr:pyridoxal-dependent decarboxylase, exosortase A system-associated [Herbaspirillum sp.]
MNSTTKPGHAGHTGHPEQQNFPILNGCLHIGGIPVTRLAQRVGKTPFYAYDRSLLIDRVKYLRRVLPSDISLHYSVKANPMPALVQCMANLVDGFDVASGGELKVALDTTMKPVDISFAGPGKNLAELSQAVSAGVIVSVESEREVNILVDIGEALGVAPRVSVRVNPDFEMKTSGMKMGGGAKPFGVDAESVPQLLRRLGSLGVDFQGMQIFSGSQSLNPAAIMEAQSRTFELAFRLAQYASTPVRSLNIGGGFGIPYFPGDLPLDVAQIGYHLAQWMPRVHAALPGSEIIVELGRYLVGEAGIYVTRVIDRKVSRGQIFLVVDGGLHHHLAASGNFGQVIRKNYPVAVASASLNAAREVVSVVGPLCTPLDVLAAQTELPAADVGDLIVVFQSGAYGLTASPTAFLGHPAPGEVLL